MKHAALSARMDGLRSSAIRDLLTLTARPDVISLAGGLPDPLFIPRERISKAAYNALGDPSSVQYGETSGLRRLREVIAARESVKIGRTLDSSDVVITHGSQQGLSLLAQVLLDAGDVVVVEDPAYTGALQVFRTAQATLVPVPLDADGMDTAALEAKLVAGLRPKVVHTVSNFHNPRGSVLSAERRAHLAHLADRYGFWVLEDDPYGELYFDGPPPLPVAALSERVIRLSSASKVLAPALRVGWLHGDRRVCEAVELIKQGADLCGSSLTQQIAADLFSDHEWLDAHLDMLRASYGSRAKALVSALEDGFGDTARFSTVRGGMFCWMDTTAEVDTASVLDIAVEHGVAFVPGNAFAVDADLSRSARLCFATYPETVLQDAAQKLRDAFAAAVLV
ncbi:aspartate aminotransferase [Rhodococcus sp. SRB_17]|uniref:aminotransferase-like domain-containing protein n=1 Tax=Rhodococcus sp. OK302 TaxID=1882769 RepID=UPI000B940F9E|nr:PLP-dependent aminotransferase family protein [Rhodococcus sp. OK302]NMM91377.1 aspartate aminotransferase [Rhodococcus sp. SRB_17]OYD69111.1 2-aminoadipate transaminase [Rhodococcus sp. OK302]